MPTTLTNDQAKRIAAGIFTAAMIFLLVWTYYARLKPYVGSIFDQLQFWIQTNYGWVYDIVFGIGQTGWWGKWLVIAFIVGMFTNWLTTAAGTFLVLVILVGFWTKGPATQLLPDGRGGYTTVATAEAQQAGRIFILFLGGIVAVVVFSHVFAASYGHFIPALLVAGGGHAAGLYYHMGRNIKVRVWMWIAPFVLLPPILHQLWIASFHFNPAPKGQQNIEHFLMGPNGYGMFIFLVVVAVGAVFAVSAAWKKK